MLRRRLGRTDLDVSVVGFGGGPLNEIPPAEAVPVLKAAIARGINLFDTAPKPWYGYSEESIGRAIHGRRDGLVIMSRTHGTTAEEALAEVRMSLDALAIDQVDVYQISGVSTPERYNAVMGPGGALQGLKEAQRLGQIRHIGVSSHGTPETMAALVRSGEFATLMVAYNLVDYHVETYAQPLEDMARIRNEILPLAQQYDVGVVAMKPLAGGLLVAHRSPLFRGLSSQTLAISPQQAISYLLMNPGFASALVGMCSMEELEENVVAGEAPLSLSVEEAAGLLEEATKLGTDFCRRCAHCEPCPEGIQIAKFFRVVYMARVPSQSVRKAALALLETMPVMPEFCTACGVCEERCPYELAIAEKLEAGLAIVNELRARLDSPVLTI
jgi:predicted aldo/keto reductase-like oxidoreductase